MQFLVGLFILFFIIPAAFAADGLHIEGNKIYYGNREVQLQGLAIGDPLLGRNKRPLSDYEAIAHEWNANVVRISIHPGTWRDYGRKETLRVLRENVDAALNAGMFVIIIWHAIGEPDNYMQEAPEGYVRDLYDTNFELAKDFWLHVSQEFGHDGRIMFELWNEPVWPELADGSQALPKWDELKPRWEDLIGMIRSISPNLIIVTSNGWGYNLQGVRQNLLADDNIAYSWHVYAGTDHNDPVAWENNLGGLADVRPVFVTEWGFDPTQKNTAYYGNADNYGYLFYDRFIKDKHLHYTAWCWHPDWSPRMLESDWKTLTAYGKFVMEIQWRTNKEMLVRP